MEILWTSETLVSYITLKAEVEWFFETLVSYHIT
jgi:hypothetical protein